MPADIVLNIYIFSYLEKDRLECILNASYQRSNIHFRFAQTLADEKEEVQNKKRKERKVGNLHVGGQIIPIGIEKRPFPLF